MSSLPLSIPLAGHGAASLAEIRHNQGSKLGLEPRLDTQRPKCSWQDRYGIDGRGIYPCYLIPYPMQALAGICLKFCSGDLSFFHTVGHCPEICFPCIYLEYGKQWIIRFGNAEILHKRTVLYAFCLHFKIINEPNLA